MPTRTIQLRRGDARDIAVVERLMGAAFDARYGEAWTRGQTLGVLSLPGVALTIAAFDDAPAGFALVRTIVDEAELLLIAVAPTMRRCGIGAALIRTVVADCSAADIAKLHLEVRAGNDAVKLYVANGFAKVGERRAYYRGTGGQAHDAHTYSRVIG